jgi:hypothetical protein
MLAGPCAVIKRALRRHVGLAAPGGDPHAMVGRMFVHLPPHEQSPNMPRCCRYLSNEKTHRAWRGTWCVLLDGLLGYLQ